MWPGDPLLDALPALPSPDRRDAAPVGLVDAAMAEIAKIQAGQIAEADLEKVKQARILGIRESAKNNCRWSGDIEWSLRAGEPLSTQEELESRINAVTLKDLQAVARKYLKADERKLFVLMPESARAANSPK